MSAAWRKVLSQLQVALDAPVRSPAQFGAVQDLMSLMASSGGGMPRLDTVENADAIEKKLIKLLGDAPSKLQAMEAALGQMLDEGAPLDALARLAAAAVLLNMACLGLASTAAVGDRRAMFSLMAAALHFASGNAMRLQPRLAAPSLQGAAGRDVQLAGQLVAVLLGSTEMVHLQPALQREPDALAAAFGCALLHLATTTLDLACEPWNAATAEALGRTAAKPSALLPWAARLAPSVERLQRLDVRMTGSKWQLPLPGLLYTMLSHEAFRAHALATLTQDRTLTAQLVQATLACLLGAVQWLDAAEAGGQPSSAAGSQPGGAGSMAPGEAAGSVISAGSKAVIILTHPGLNNELVAAIARGQPEQELKLSELAPRASADVVTLCEAAAAMLRLLPPLQQTLLQPPAGAAAPAGLSDAAAKFPACLLPIAVAVLPAVNELNVRLTSSAKGQEAAVVAQAEPLFLLHTVAVRFLHWLSALDDAQLAAMPALATWDAWHTMVHVTFSEAVAIYRMGRTLAAEQGNTQQEAAFSRRLHSLCLAHAPLVPLISGKTGRPFDNPDLGFYTELLYIVSYTPLAALDPLLVAGFERSVRSSLQAAADNSLVEYVWEGVQKWLVQAEEQPQYCVFLLNSGLAHEGLAAAEAAAVAKDMPLPSIARRLLATVHICCSNLLAAAAAELPAPNRPSTASEAENPHMRAISAACFQLESALRRLPAGFPPPPRLATLQRYRGSVLPAAAGLAGVLLAYWHSQEQLQAGQLAAARAAGARSCAYLRCANLGCEGGARAGTGDGCSKCSACKAVWYCGTACSHADWRAGHRRMCKLLKEARAAERSVGET
ncbi:Zinc finger MYND domain-containing 19 Q7TSV3 [Chlorella sorokiniana]|uniref:Zinc finger MYND domain-containing 19 Q7TSV3 n=1 Tax=Chlorella sorokiniana TaxID=3076 RepID=A0A2P6TE95_CHLSO|nr:Zinc finger MYND domain-containing 19 Q7TSV3 [Chlorella sorokiniana]|eukprot:PRW20964.1 Zinc finger MYND domain-containing 19 Q7TSV3 [Chlorella sorokiniana]